MSLSKEEKKIDVNNFSSPQQTLDFLKNHVRAELLSKISTGNPVYDVILAFAILSAQETVTDLLGWVKKHILNFPGRTYRFIIWLIGIYKKWRYPDPVEVKKEKMVNKSATVKFITDGREVNTLFDPVMWYLNSITDAKKEHDVSLETTRNNSEIVSRVPDQRTAKFVFLDHEFTYSIRKELITIYGKHEQKRENVIISLDVKVEENRPTDIFSQLSEMCVRKYQEYSSKKKWEQMKYRNRGGAWTSQKNKIPRKMETVILKERQAELLIEDINEFLHKEEWYISREVPYTRRYMFWGKPGTGKSSCIKALASHTKRHTHYLILSEVKSDSELFSLMENIDYSNTILVIEDIDCASKVTHSRDMEHNKQNDEKGNSSNTQDLSNDNQNNKPEENQPETSKLTLSGLLNAIDGGMLETHGQIMVMTTNHPEHLDKALIRPGRVDMKFEFGRCDNYQIEGLFYNFFEKKPPFHHNFPSEKISPAEVTNVLLQYKKNPDEAWKQLIEIHGS